MRLGGPTRAALVLLLASACPAAGDDSGDAGPLCEAGWICPVMGTGTLGFNGDGLPGLETRLASPTAVRESPDGHIVVVDYSNMKVRQIVSDGTVETLAGNGYHAYAEEGVPATESPLENPVDALWLPDGRLAILPQHEGRVVAVDEDGLIEVIVGTGFFGDSADGEEALDLSMGYGAGLAVASDGSLFITDLTFNRIRRVDPEGVLCNVLGTGAPGASHGGHGPEVPLHFPERIVVDEARGRLLVADTDNHSVLALDLDTLAVTVLAGDGSEGWSGDGGSARSAQLSEPVGVEVRDDGTVLVAEVGNGVIRAVDPDGTIRTVAGQGPGVEPAADADPADGAEPEDFLLQGPAGLAWTAAGDLLIAERSGHRVLRWEGAADAL